MFVANESGSGFVHTLHSVAKEDGRESQSKAPPASLLPELQPARSATDTIPNMAAGARRRRGFRRGVNAVGMGTHDCDRQGALALWDEHEHASPTGTRKSGIPPTAAWASNSALHQHAPEVCR